MRNSVGMTLQAIRSLKLPPPGMPQFNLPRTQLLVLYTNTLFLTSVTPQAVRGRGETINFLWWSRRNIRHSRGTQT